MIKFSNMTLQEFINLNRDEIPADLLEYFEELLKESEYKYDALEEDFQIVRDRCEELENILEGTKSTIYKY